MKSKIYFGFGILVMVMGMLCLTSCSVFMAANKKGTSIDQLTECKTRSCLITKGAVSLNSKKNKNGSLAEETFQVRKPTGSASRAVMHGALDVATFGIWEVAGTPMEGVMGQNEMYLVKVLYKDDGEEIRAIQLGQ